MSLELVGFMDFRPTKNLGKNISNCVDTLQFEIGMLEGFFEDYGDNVAFYVTNCNLVGVRGSLKCIGYCSELTPSATTLKDSISNSEWIHVNLSDGTLSIINSKENYNIICIWYNYNRFKESEITTYEAWKYGTHFEVLLDMIRTENSNLSSSNNYYFYFFIILNLIYYVFSILSKVCDKISFVNKYSEMARHFENNVDILKWTFSNIKSKRKISLRTGNVLIGRLFDFFIGFVVIHYALRYENEIIAFVGNSAETIIQGLKQLLIFLMGSPVGFKLNFFLNQKLGSFFMYHLSLWRAFLSSMRPFLHYIFHLLIIPGSLGLTFQIALLEDFIAFSTLHVYCIYVYAARLYRIQIIGLSSLWLLVRGKKYNPLRKRIDSYQYTHHQLFIGTLGFTILLFLWPTTFMYSTIFTTLRIVLILLGRILTYLRFVLQFFPLYTILMWLSNSPSLGGTVEMKIGHQKGNIPFCLRATLLKCPLRKTILYTLPDTLPSLPPLKWISLIKSLFNGVLL